MQFPRRVCTLPNAETFCLICLLLLIILAICSNLSVIVCLIQEMNSLYWWVSSSTDSSSIGRQPLELAPGASRFNTHKAPVNDTCAKNKNSHYHCAFVIAINWISPVHKCSLLMLLMLEASSRKSSSVKSCIKWLVLNIWNAPPHFSFCSVPNSRSSHCDSWVLGGTYQEWFLLRWSVNSHALSQSRDFQNLYCHSFVYFTGSILLYSQRNISIRSCHWHYPWGKS